MTVQLSTAVNEARLDALEVTLGPSAKLHLRTGPQPASCASPNSGGLVCRLSLPADYFAHGASKTKLGIWEGIALANATVGHWRLLDDTETVCHAQGSCSLEGAGGDLQLNNTIFAISQLIVVNTFTLVGGNG